MSEIIENDDKTKSEIKMIGQPTIKQMFGENEKGVLSVLSEEAYASLWSDINKTPKNRLLEELHSRYHRERDISPFKAFLKSKMYKPNDEDIRREVNDYLNTEAEKAKRNTSLTEDKSETGEWWTQIKSHLISWFRGKRPNNEKGRFALYKLSFALGLDWEEHCTLFSKVFRMKTYLRTPAEFCLTYCKEKGASYAEAFDLYVQYVQYCSPDSGTNGSGDYQATREIGKDIFSLKKDEFLAMIVKNGNSYFVKSKTILRAIGLETDKDIGKIQEELNGYVFHDLFRDLLGKSETASEFYVSIESALRSSRSRKTSDDKMKEASTGRKHILQLRKIYIILQLSQFLKSAPADKISFVEFIRDIDDYLLSMNLPMLYYSDDFDRGIIMAAAYITVCGGLGEFSDKHDYPLSDIITAIVNGSSPQV